MAKFSAVWNAISDSVSEISFRCSLRACLWIITVVGGILPPILASDVSPTFNIYDVAQSVNQAGLFRDFYYISVVIALIGICNIIDTLFKGYRPNSFIAIAYICGFAYCLFMVLYGILEFGRLADHHEEKYILPLERFIYDFHSMIAIGAVGFFIELLLAFRGE